MSPSRRKRSQLVNFSLVGAGRLGLPLGRALARHPGFRLIGAACRSAASARRAIRRLGIGRPFQSVAEAAADADLILVCIPDRSIRPVAALMAAACKEWTGRTVLHSSGALAASELAALSRLGARTGSIHPLQTFSGDRGDGRRLRDCVYAIEGEPAALRVARSMATALGGRAITLTPQEKGSYHLCACLVSNYLISLVSFGQDLFPGLPASHSAWMRQFGPLMSATLDHLERAAPKRALTGPISRGDGATLSLHLKQLHRKGAGLTALHDILALRAVDLARAGGRIDDATAAGLRRLLRRLPGRSRPQPK